MGIISEETQAAVVQAYLDGEKVASIATRLGLPLSTVYWVMQKHGVAPSRAKRTRLATEDAGALLDALDERDIAIAEQEELIAALEAEIQELRRQLRAFGK